MSFSGKSHKTLGRFYPHSGRKNPQPGRKSPQPAANQISISNRKTQAAGFLKNRLDFQIRGLVEADSGRELGYPAKSRARVCMFTIQHSSGSPIRLLPVALAVSVWMCRRTALWAVQVLMASRQGSCNSLLAGISLLGQNSMAEQNAKHDLQARIAALCQHLLHTTLQKFVANAVPQQTLYPITEASKAKIQALQAQLATRKSLNTAGAPAGTPPPAGHTII